MPFGLTSGPSQRDTDPDLHMAIVNDVLVFYPTFKKKGSKYVELEVKVVIPDSLQMKIVALLHDHILVGAHVGRNVLYDKIYAKF